MAIINFKLTEDLKQFSFWRGVIAELVGDTILLFIGCGSILMGTTIGLDPNVPITSADITRIAFTFGFTITCLVWTLGPVSGAHLNPAVSLALFCIGKASLVRAVFYICAQCCGAILGSALLYAVVPDTRRTYAAFGTTGKSADIDVGQAVVTEMILTFMLVFTICACIDDGRKDHGKGKATIPLTIGLAIIILNLMGIPYTGASLNPARSLGPAVVGNFWTDHWVYWVGPIAGGCIGSLLYHLVFSSALHPDNAGIARQMEANNA